MTDKITSITGGKRHPKHNHEPNMDVVELLERTLQEAKEGHLHSVAVIGMRHDDTLIMAGRLAPEGDGFRFVGAIDMVKADIRQAILDQI